MAGYEFDSFHFDTRTGILTKSGSEVALRPMAGKLLLLFLENPEAVFSKDDLKLHVWPGSHAELDGNLATLLHDLRVALGERPDGRVYVRNLPRRGYQFSAAVHRRNPGEIDAWSKGSPNGAYAEKVRLVADESGSPMNLPAAASRRLGALSRATIAAICIVAGVVANVLWPAPRLSVVRYSQLSKDEHDKGGHLLTDGVRVYFSEPGPDEPTFNEISVRGSDTEPVNFPAHEFTAVDISRDGSEFLAARWIASGVDSELWIVPLGGSPRPVGSLKGDSARWSPDERQIAFTLHHDVLVANADGSAPTRVATVPGQALDVGWSPDGKTLSFAESNYDNVEETRRLWEVSSQGSNLHELLKGWNDHPSEYGGTWTPDGKFYIFVSERGGRRELWSLPERRFGRASGAPARLSYAAVGFSRQVVGVDGKEIFAIGEDRRGELVRLDSRLHDLVRFLGGISASWVVFARSGREYAYESYPDGIVWRSNVDGSEKTQITFLPLETDGLAWSPDGSQLALRARKPGSPYRIYLVPSHGGEPQMAMTGDSEQGVPTWSPDGTKIAFGDVPEHFERPNGKEAIHIFELGTQTLTDLPGSKGLWSPRWSPDGRYVAALTIVGQRLMLYDMRTKKWRQTAADKVDNPSWSADSKNIYFDTEGNDRLLRRFSLVDGHAATLKNLNSFPRLAAGWSGLAPDDSPIILRNIGKSEVYSLAIESR